MTLKEAIKTLVDAKGLDILKTPMSLNILSDFNAFEEHPASKNILKNVISEGYLEKIAFFYDNGLPVGDTPNTYVKDMYNKLGFRSDISVYVINAILGALGLSEIASDGFNNSASIEIEKPVSPSLSVPENDGKHLEFKGIPINGTKEAVASQLERMGYKFIDGGVEGILLGGKFAGIDNCQILISSSLHTGKTYSISVFTPQSLNWWGVKGEYEKVKSMLQKKYGNPTERTEFFSDPYEEGDGYELTAFSTGNAFFVTKYTTNVGEIRTHITNDAQVLITYVDKENSDEHEIAESISAENDI